jgi:hypothetical protein
LCHLIDSAIGSTKIEHYVGAIGAFLAMYGIIYKLESEKQHLEIIRLYVCPVVESLVAETSGYLIGFNTVNS